MKYFIAVMTIITIGCVTNFVIYSQQTNKGTSETTDPKPALSWQQDEHSLSLLNHGQIVWRLNYDKTKDKPYFYPLRTLGGIDLALQRPKDHPWHRGLWFAWKSINGVNYWEEDPESGLSKGRSLIKKVVVKKHDDYSATIIIMLQYAPAGKSPVLHEKRTLVVSSPDQKGNYYIDWHQTFTAEVDVVLDRKSPLKYGGVKWGGYAGLSFRANMNKLISIRYLDSNGWRRSKSLTGYGKNANWMDLSGMTRGANKRTAGLTIFDHLANPRHPSPWYVWYDNQGRRESYKHAFFTPAFLYNKPFELESGKSFTLQYRTLIHKGTGTMDRLKAEYQKYINK